MEPINYGVIGFNILVMTITVVVILAVYALKTNQTSVATTDWLVTNWGRFLLGFVVIVGISVLVVISPDVALLFGALGYNAERSPIGLGLFVSALLIGLTTEPAEGGGA